MLVTVPPRSYRLKFTGWLILSQLLGPQVQAGTFTTTGVSSSSSTIRNYDSYIIGDGSTATQFTLNDAIPSASAFTVKNNANLILNATLGVANIQNFVLEAGSQFNIPSGSLQFANANANGQATINGSLLINNTGSLSNPVGQSLNLNPGGIISVSGQAAGYNSALTLNATNNSLDNPAFLLNNVLKPSGTNTTILPATLDGNGNLDITAQGAVNLGAQYTNLDALNLVDSNGTTVVNAYTLGATNVDVPVNTKLVLQGTDTSVLNGSTASALFSVEGTLKIVGSQILDNKYGGGVSEINVADNGVIEFAISDANTYDNLTFAQDVVSYGALNNTTQSIIRLVLTNPSAIHDGDTFTVMNNVGSSHPDFILEYPSNLGITFTQSSEGAVFARGNDHANLCLTASVASGGATVPSSGSTGGTLTPSLSTALLAQGSPLAQALTQVVSDPSVLNSRAGLYLQNLQNNPEGLAQALEQLTLPSQTANTNLSAQQLNLVTSMISSVTSLSRFERLSGLTLNQGYVAGDSVDTFRVLNPMLLINRARASSGAGVSGFKAHTQGLVLAAEQSPCLELTLGVAGGFAHSDLEGFDSAQTQNTVNSHLLNLYSHYLLDDFYFETQLSLSASGTKSRRNISFAGTQASSRSHSLQTGLRFKAGFEQLNPYGSISPYLLAETAHNQTRAYQESGAGALGLRVGPQQGTQTRLGLGIQINFFDTIFAQKGLLTLSAQYLKSVHARNPSLNVGFINSSVDFPVTQSTLARDSVNLHANFKLWSTVKSALAIEGSLERNGKIYSRAAFLNYKYAF